MGPPGSIIWIYQDPLHGSTRIHQLNLPGSNTWIHKESSQDPPSGATRIHHFDPPGSILWIYKDPPGSIMVSYAGTIMILISIFSKNNFKIDFANSLFSS